MFLSLQIKGRIAEKLACENSVFFCREASDFDRLNFPLEISNSVLRGSVGMPIPIKFKTELYRPIVVNNCDSILFCCLHMLFVSLHALHSMIARCWRWEGLPVVVRCIIII